MTTAGNALPRRALVLGLGRTGRAVATALVARGVRVQLAEVCPLDAVPVLPGVEVHHGTDGQALVAGVDLVVPSPGVPRSAPALLAAQRVGVPVWSEIELAARLLPCPIVAITGTNGKSTVTTLVGLALARAGRRTFTGGNLGTPLISAVDQAPEIAVAEVSSFQLEWVERFRPAVGCLLNVTPDHLDRHPTFADYRDTKARLFAAQRADDAAVLNRDDAEVWGLAPRLRARVFGFGAGSVAGGAFVAGSQVVLRLPALGEERYPLDRTALTGAHNRENILAAVVVARLAGAPAEAVQEAIDTCTPLPHRLARVAERRGVAWYDDSKATNVGAAARSLDSFAGPVILLAGGLDKGGGYELLVRHAAGKVRRAIVFGAARARIGGALAAAGVPTEEAASLDDAVRVAARIAVRGDTVLLAPACASFDMFSDYAARGRAFQAAVEALP